MPDDSTAKGNSRSGRAWIPILACLLVAAITGLVWLNSSGPVSGHIHMDYGFEPESVVPLGPIEDLPRDTMIIYAGIHVSKVYELSLQSRTFSADGFLWLEWPASVQEQMIKEEIAPLDLFRLVNGIESWDSTLETVTSEPEPLPGGRFYQRYRFSSRFYDDQIGFKRDPFDSLSLPVIIEVAPASMSNKYSDVHLIPHHHVNGFLGKSGSLSGYRLDRATFEPYLHKYPSRFGSWYQPTFSQMRLEIQYSSDYWSAFVNWVLPLLIVMAVVLMAPSVAGSLGDVRIAIPSTALLTLIFLQQAYHSGIPPLPYLTFLDELFACSYLISMALFVLFTWGTNVYASTPESERVEASRRIDRTDFIFQCCALLFFAGTALVAWFR
jgi:hypothetical protein